MLKVGVIGVGTMGKHHARVFNDLKNVDLVGVCDIKKERVVGIGEKYYTNSYTDYKEMLKEGVDAVSIVVPTKTHMNVTIDAINKGKDVLVEKPIAASVPEAEKIIRAAKETGIRLMVGHIERFNPVVQKLKKIMENGELGKPLFINATRIGPFAERTHDVGVIRDLATHDLDVIRFLVRENPNEIFCHDITEIKTNFSDFASISLKFNSNLRANIEASWISAKKIRNLRILGSEAVTELDYINQSLVLANASDMVRTETFSDFLLDVDLSEEREIRAEREEPLKIELDHFVRCVENGKEPLVTGEDGLIALRMAMKALESSKLGKWVRF